MDAQLDSKRRFTKNYVEIDGFKALISLEQKNLFEALT